MILLCSNKCNPSNSSNNPLSHMSGILLGIMYKFLCCRLDSMKLDNQVGISLLTPNRSMESGTFWNILLSFRVKNKEPGMWDMQLHIKIRTNKIQVGKSNIRGKLSTLHIEFCKLSTSLLSNCRKIHLYTLEHKIAIIFLQNMGINIIFRNCSLNSCGSSKTVSQDIWERMNELFSLHKVLFCKCVRIQDFQNCQ